MRFLADMGACKRAVASLREQGYEGTHLRDQGLQRLSNDEIFQKAASEARVIVTFDLDFGEIAALSRDRKVSVVAFRLRRISWRSRPRASKPSTAGWAGRCAVCPI